ncbi:MAG: hypothetical protein WCF78_00120 [archaeon]
MVLQDSILLQISQKQTNYNDLLLRMTPNYKSSDSAKAALSRALKNLISFGEIEKKEELYILTEKGKHTVDSKLKNKILIVINDLLSKSKKANSLQYIDDIIKNIQVFIEKSKTDPSLIKVAKTSSTFYISDLNYLKEDIENKVTHYHHLLEILQKQINILQEENFEDFYSINLDENAFFHVENFCKINNLTDITIDCDKDSPETILLFVKNSKFTRKSDYVFSTSIINMPELKNILLSNFENTIQAKFKIYLNDILIKTSFGKLYFFGPYNLISKIKDEINKKEEIKKEEPIKTTKKKK